MKGKDLSIYEIIEGRIKLQSVKRYLEYCGIPVRSDFINTEKFRRIYSNWTLLERRNFLNKVVGFKANQLKEIIENKF
jgi:hypothetical protein